MMLFCCLLLSLFFFVFFFFSFFFFFLFLSSTNQISIIHPCNRSLSNREDVITSCLGRHGGMSLSSYLVSHRPSKNTIALCRTTSHRHVFKGRAIQQLL